MFLETDLLEEIKKLDKMYVMMVLHALNPEFDHEYIKFLLVRKFLQWRA